MRLALSEPGLADAPWVAYAPHYDEFDISGTVNSIKTIWVEFKDRAGNIRTQHAFATVNYSNSLLSFDIEYFTDSGLTNSMGNNPYLKAGNYFLKISSNQDLSNNPNILIDAEGSNNDVVSDLSAMFNPRIFYYTRTIVTDIDAIGEILEQIAIQGITPMLILNQPIRIPRPRTCQLLLVRRQRPSLHQLGPGIVLPERAGIATVLLKISTGLKQL